MELKAISEKNMKILNRDLIKYIAMFTMLLNHIAHVFLTSGPYYVRYLKISDTLRRRSCASF